MLKDAVRPNAVVSIDVEEWFHILDSPATPLPEKWGSLESRVQGSMELLLKTLAETDTKATFFWLGWMARRHRDLLLRTHQAGHEIACHGDMHVLPYEVGPERFRADISVPKREIEDLIGESVAGLRAPGFGITEEASWAFDVIREAGYVYDSSIFPASRAHGGMKNAKMGPHTLTTASGPLYEFPMSVVEIFGRRLALFGGGYLRLSPLWLIRWGLGRLEADGIPLVVYVHPREVDPDHPRLPLGAVRHFKSYVNLRSTLPKLEWICRNCACVPMRDMIDVCFPESMGQ